MSNKKSKNSLIKLIVSSLTVISLCIPFTFQAFADDKFNIKGNFGDTRLTIVGGIKVITTTQGHLKVKTPYDESFIDVKPYIDAMWHFSIEDEDGTLTLVKSSPNNKNVSVYSLNPLTKEVVFISNLPSSAKNTTLNIDPTIIKTKNTITGEVIYYASYTQVVGNVNNSVPAEKGGTNGTYTIKMFESQDLENWHPIASISKKQNLEDGKFFFDRNRLYFAYEKEKYDSGPSEIMIYDVKTSQEKVLVNGNFDNEFANIIRNKNNQYIVFYSAEEIVNLKGGYERSEVHYSVFDDNFEPIATSIKLDTHGKGILLFDVYMKGSSTFFLYARNFGSSNQTLEFAN